ncbi:hypothetical protein AALO_G00240820 [Alosa alosa]|uniref:Supervillin n=1 Tax=Alosa alosa TaxID=278164 RepID=A0AAV6FR41_9TELE|nr:hypothetical protein AALO_G00240820 [Alosa alosa]
MSVCLILFVTHSITVDRFASSLLKKRSHSFDIDRPPTHKAELVKSASDIDANLRAILPKVSELRKHFETTKSSESEMNRKERIARRLEGIEADAPPALVPSMQHVPGLVANRLLEEDTPRYMRASDPCDPGIMVRRYAGDEGSTTDRQSRARNRGEPAGSSQEGSIQQGAPSDAIPALVGSTKAERIARYKAERRRQLSERYGILLDQEAEPERHPRQSHSRREGRSQAQEDEEARSRGDERSRPQYSQSGVGRVFMPANPDPTPAEPLPPERGKRGSFSERERVLNVENHRRGSRTRQPPPEDAPVVMETTLGRGVMAVPSSPRTARRASLPSTRQGISPGDLFIEQQAQNILSRQGLATLSQSDWSLVQDSDSNTHSHINWPSRIRFRERQARDDRGSDAGLPWHHRAPAGVWAPPCSSSGCPSPPYPARGTPSHRDPETPFGHLGQHPHETRMLHISYLSALLTPWIHTSPLTNTLLPRLTVTHPNPLLRFLVTHPTMAHRPRFHRTPPQSPRNLRATHFPPL